MWYSQATDSGLNDKQPKTARRILLRLYRSVYIPRALALMLTVRGSAKRFYNHSNLASDIQILGISEHL